MTVTPTTSAPASDPPTDTDVDPRMFLTAAEVGQLLGVGASRVYAMAAAGQLPIVRLGRRIHFPRRGLEGLVDASIERAREGKPLPHGDSGLRHR